MGFRDGVEQGRRRRGVGGRAGDGESQMGDFAVFVSEVEDVAAEGEFEDVDAEFEGETKERRRGRGSWGGCAARGLRMGGVIRQRGLSEVDTLQR